MSKKTKISRHRVITMLSRKEMDFLDKLGKDALFSTGRKLTYNAILRGLLNFALEIGLSGEGITSFQDLKEKIAGVFKKAQTGHGFPTPYEILINKEEHPKKRFLKSGENKHE